MKDIALQPIIVLDASPLGLLCHPRNPAPVLACRRWLSDLVVAGRQIVVPEISDYEVRRELLRNNSQRALINLDQLISKLRYLPITTPDIRKAAELWAWARQNGVPTAAYAALDGDVILAAQALSLNQTALVATTNPAHLTRYVQAELWTDIKP